MKYENGLLAATLIRRYKRFLADVRFSDGTMATAHCPNPGSMLGLADPGAAIYLEDRRGRGGKLDWGWELTRTADSLVGINTGRANRLTGEAIGRGLPEALSVYTERRAEVRYGERSRIDWLLSGPGRPDFYLEVKSVTLRRPDGPHPTAAEFPDSVTARGSKHLRELARMVAAGHRAGILYLVQRQDCDHVRIAGDIDPTYAHGMAAARAEGVEVFCLTCKVDTDGIAIAGGLPVVLG